MALDIERMQQRARELIIPEVPLVGKMGSVIDEMDPGVRLARHIITVAHRDNIADYVAAKTALRHRPYIQNTKTGVSFKVARVHGGDVIKQAEEKLALPGEFLGEALDRLYGKEGRTQGEIGQMVGVARQTVISWFDRLSVDSRRCDEVSDNIVLTDREKQIVDDWFRSLKMRAGIVEVNALFAGKGALGNSAAGEWLPERIKEGRELQKYRALLGEDLGGMVTDSQLEVLNLLHPYGGLSPNKLRDVAQEKGGVTTAAISLSKKRAFINLRTGVGEIQKL